jgi:DNA-directed RNA polymerase subunit RPC12/RpoP
MEKLHVTCPSCRSGIRVPVEHAGQSGKCSKCGAEVRIPLAPEPASATTTEPTPRAAVE